tara:strand:+ start:1691 stop:2032 length:342 start_codon:yes stop_codon:yes gene_type:complete
LINQAYHIGAQAALDEVKTASLRETLLARIASGLLGSGLGYSGLQMTNPGDTWEDLFTRNKDRRDLAAALAGGASGFLLGPKAGGSIRSGVLDTAIGALAGNVAQKLQTMEED